MFFKITLKFIHESTGRKDKIRYNLTFVFLLCIVFGVSYHILFIVHDGSAVVPVGVVEEVPCIWNVIFIFFSGFDQKLFYGSTSTMAIVVFNDIAIFFLFFIIIKLAGSLKYSTVLRNYFLPSVYPHSAF